MKANKVYLIGAGPGKADLITVRGLKILKKADVIIYDYLVDKSILEHAREGGELICCDKLAKKGKYSDGNLIHQGRINNLTVRKALEGKRVVRLKNGDPSIFSRTAQELEALLKQGIDFEIVPGVSAANAAAAFSGIPLTDRELSSSCSLVTGHEAYGKKKSSVGWDLLAKSGTIVLYMTVANLEKIVKRLLSSGKDKNTAVAIIQNATLLNQRVLNGTLGDIVKKAKKHKLTPPAIIIIGEVAKLERRFNWLKRNKKVIFTGLCDERFFVKGTSFHLPLIKIEPLEDYAEFDAYLSKINNFDWLVFCSRYGVEYFFKRLTGIGQDCRVLAGTKIAAVGESTKKRLLDFGILADLVPERESAKGLIEEFAKTGLKDKRVFLPRSDISDKGLEAGLRTLGANITSSFAYKNVMPQDLPELDLNAFDEIIFSSPSTVRNFIKRYKRIPRQVKVSCIGEVTQKEAKRWGILN